MRLQRQHANRVAVRFQYGFDQQAVNITSRLDGHSAFGDHFLRRAERLRRNMVKHAHLCRRVACRHAHRRAERHAALIRAGNADAHRVFIQVVVQRDRQMANFALCVCPRRCRVERDCHRFRAARGRHDNAVDSLQKIFIIHLVFLRQPKSIASASASVSTP